MSANRHKPAALPTAVASRKVDPFLAVVRFEQIRRTTTGTLVRRSPHSTIRPLCLVGCRKNFGQSEAYRLWSKFDARYSARLSQIQDHGSRGLESVCDIAG
jgi:hypothetical protein